MKRIKYIVPILLLIATNLIAQGKFGHVTPSTADFIKYGEVPVSLFNGKINYDVPIYRIKDNDFDIPISLTYTSDGFKPAKRPGFAGMDWFLNGGGCITREVYGSPDDSYPISLDGGEVGYWWAIEGKQYTNSMWWNFSTNLITCIDSYTGCNGPMTDGYYSDYQPDLFLFNFGGNSGQFMIDNSRNIQTNIKGYSVNMYSFAKQLQSNILPNPSEITIQAPDGYTYIFGGNLSALEFSISFQPSVQPNNTNPTILAWHLSKIIAPNGRSVKFNYTTVDFTSNSLQYDSPLWQSSKTTIRNPNAQYSAPFIDTYSATKTVVLESIEVEDTKQKVEFFKSQETGYSTFYSDTYEYYNSPGYKLDSVKVTYNNERVQSSALNYEMQGKRKFLSEYVTADKSKYKFNYNHYYYYPEPDISFPVDFYGYWNANNSDNSYCLLTKIEYPTGGYTNFLYQKNQYSKRVEISLSQGTNNLVTVAGETGGARIKKISNYDSNNIKKSEKTYLYTDAGNVGSGILYQYPPYDGSAFIDPQAWISNMNVGQPHIGYSVVTEQNVDGSYTENRFSDFVSNPDYSDAKINQINSGVNVSLEWMFTKVNRITSNASNRGLLRVRKYVDAIGNEVKTEDFSYRNSMKAQIKPAPAPGDETNSGDLSNNDIVSYRPIINGGMAKKISLVYNPLIYKEETTNSVKTKTYIDYNNYDLVKTEKIIDSKNDTLKTSYKYPADFATLNNTYGTMVENNVINRLIQEQKYKNDKCLFTKKNVYKMPFSSLLPLLDSIKTSIGNAPLRSIEEYSIYDSYGNPVYITSKDATKTALLWGYKGQQLIAKIENATYTDVKTAIGGFSPESLSQSDSYDPGIIANLRSNTTNLSNAQITTYTCKPLVGITSQTDSRGITTNYNYDTYNRLSLVSNNDNKIVGRNQYAYYAGNGSNQGYVNIEATLKTNSIVYVLGTTGSSSISVTGGSGNFRYDWYLKNSDGAELQTGTNSPSFNYTCSQLGALTIQCRVTDNVTGLVVTKEETIQSKYALAGSITVDKDTYAANNVIMASAYIIYTSNDYICSWRLKNSSGAIIDQASNYSNMFGFATPGTGTFTLECTINDNLTGEVYNMSTEINCSPVYEYQEGNLNFTYDFYCYGSSLWAYGPEVNFGMTIVSQYNTIWLANNMLVGTVPQGFQPVNPQSSTFYSDGRTWQITFNPDTSVVITLLEGASAQPGTTLYFGGTYQRW